MSKVPKLFNRYNPKTSKEELVILSKDQHEAVNSIVESSEPLHFITGEAGCGKSFAVHALKSFHPIKVTAPTARAAYLIDGQTLDGFLNFNREYSRFNNKNGLSDILNGCPRDILVDEGSMFGHNFFEAVYPVLKDYGKRLIIVGDFAQAPPVKDRWVTESSMFKPVIHRLKTNYRQSEEFLLTTLNNIRQGIVTPEIDEFMTELSFKKAPSHSDDSVVILYATNSKANNYNAKKLSSLTTEKFTTKATVSSGNGSWLGLTDKEKEKIISDCGFAHEDLFAVGAKVIMTKNNYNDGYINSDVGTIVGIESHQEEVCDSMGFSDERKASKILVQLERNNLVIEVVNIVTVIKDAYDNPKYEVKGMPIKLGWAVTIHKSQGGTFDRVHFDVSSLSGFRFAAKKAALETGKSEEDASKEADNALHGLCYVGLSRVTTIDGLSITGWNKKYVQTNDNIKCWL